MPALASVSSTYFTSFAENGSVFRPMPEALIFTGTTLTSPDAILIATIAAEPRLAGAIRTKIRSLALPFSPLAGLNRTVRW